MSEVDGATLIARSLKQQGIDHLFGIVGFPVGPIAAAAQKEGIAYLGMRNEQTAAYAAAAYGYLTGRPGACLTVTGPGVVHGLAGLANAQQNCWPMILIGGASETYRGGMGAFQEERQVLIASPFCKFAHGIESVHAHPLLCRDGDPARDLRPPRRHLSRHARRHHQGQMRPRQGHRGRARAANRRAWWRRARMSRRRWTCSRRPSGRWFSSARAWRGRAPKTRCAPSSSARKCRSCARRWARA